MSTFRIKGTATFLEWRKQVIVLQRLRDELTAFGNHSRHKSFLSHETRSPKWLVPSVVCLQRFRPELLHLQGGPRRVHRVGEC